MLFALEESERVEALDLLALDAGLEAEVEVPERLHDRQSGTAHRRLQAPRIPERDVGAQELGQCLTGGELAAVDTAEDVIQGLQRPRHLEVGELVAQPVAQRRSGRRRGAAHAAPPRYLRWA